VENPLLQEVKDADLQGMEEVGLQEVAHYIGILSQPIESLENMAQREFSIGCLGVGITERSI
jgi:hypothetical protein